MPQLVMKTEEVDLGQAFKDLKTVIAALHTIIQAVETRRFNLCILDVAEGAQAILDVALKYSNLERTPPGEERDSADRVWIGIVARQHFETLTSNFELPTNPTTEKAIALKVCQLMTSVAITFRDILYSRTVQRALELQREYPDSVDHDRRTPPDGYV